ncbi:transglycosylase SLT domain-containing protein [Nautilia sp.]
MRLLLVLFPFFLFSLNLSEILTCPKSYVRDFYLTEFMRETNSSVLAYKAYNAMYRQKPFKHLRILSEKNPLFMDVYRCVNVKPSYLKSVDISCVLNNGLSLKSIAKLKYSDLKYLYKNLPEGKIKKAVYAFLYNDFSSVFKNRDLGYYFILNYPSARIDQFIENFSVFRDKYFYLFVKYAYLFKLKKIQSSLLKTDFKNCRDEAKWWLFLSALKNGREKLAKKILYSIKNKNSKIYFWMWRLGNNAALEKLVSLKRVDFYTLYGYEQLNKKFFIKTDILYNSVEKPKYNQENPWDVLKFWDELQKRKDLFEFARELDSNKSIALKALVLDKAFKFKYNIFITPEMYDDANISFRSFVYAIAKQESHFIPASVSRSYALGVMQIMPFLIRDYHSDVFKQFDYSENVKLGVKHLKWLFSELKDPLMVAYAYNGGIGFVRRKVIPFFKYGGKYEPFLSMESVPYDESREYGKNVIAFYVIYNHIFGNQKITLHRLLKK